MEIRRRGPQPNVERRWKRVGPAVALAAGLAFAPHPFGFDVGGLWHMDGTAVASAAAFPAELQLSPMMVVGMGFNAAELGAGALAADHIRTLRPDTKRDMHTTVVVRGNEGSGFITIEVFDAERMTDGEGNRVWNATSDDVRGMDLKISGRESVKMLGFDTSNNEPEEGVLRRYGYKKVVSKADALKPLEFLITYASGATRIVRTNFGV